MRFFFRQQNSKERVQLIFDVGSASVGSAVIERDASSSDPARVLFTTRVQIAFQEHFRYDRFVREVLQGVDTASKRAKQFLKSRPEDYRVAQISCVISSLWYHARTIPLSVKNEAPVAVTPKLVENMLEGAEERLEREVRTILEQKHITQPSVIEKKILGMALNGYTTRRPFDKRAERIELSLYLAVSPSTFLKTIKHAVSGHFPDTDVVFHSHMLSMYTAIRDHYSAYSDFIAVNISGEITDVALVQNDILQKQFSIPVGTHTLTRTIARERGGVSEEAHSLLNMMAQENPSLDQGSKEHTAVAKAGAAWRIAVTNTLHNLSSSLESPRRIFLVAPEETSHWFKHLLAHPGRESEKELGPFTVMTLDPYMTHRLLPTDTKARLDPPLMLHAFHAARV